MTRIEARYLYDRERELPNRNYANGHTFEEWYEWMFGECCK